jgi:hypothetical protein
VTVIVARFPIPVAPGGIESSGMCRCLVGDEQKGVFALSGDGSRAVGGVTVDVAACGA